MERKIDGIFLVVVWKVFSPIFVYLTGVQHFVLLPLELLSRCLIHQLAPFGSDQDAEEIREEVREMKLQEGKVIHSSRGKKFLGLVVWKR